MSTNSAQGVFEQEGYDFMAACFEVYNQLGHGFLEEVYQESLELELTERAIPFTAQARLQLFYKGRPLRKYYEADLIVIGEIVVEIKAVKTLLPEHEAQLINYLRATKKRVGYIVNFGAQPSLEWKRRIL
ncbi:GxxExxY protein [Rariglobus hedericola]|uniref:GxxExxY protein n=1 Tax=Rariglobus hedericola TaxID=2597822 RepID=A0A556QN65_9BACT|nr:GxxExxY protein [Rariglobus hedericola]TSJ78090.1 GxxExxY protein [Rariglobus hedericola]